MLSSPVYQNLHLVIHFPQIFHPTTWFPTNKLINSSPIKNSPYAFIHANNKRLCNIQLSHRLYLQSSDFSTLRKFQTLSTNNQNS